MTGGHYDVDVVLEGPSRQILYREIKQQYGQFQFTPEITGTYQVPLLLWWSFLLFMRFFLFTALIRSGLLIKIHYLIPIHSVKKRIPQISTANNNGWVSPGYCNWLEFFFWLWDWGLTSDNCMQQVLAETRMAHISVAHYHYFTCLFPAIAVLQHC